MSFIIYQSRRLTMWQVDCPRSDLHPDCPPYLRRCCVLQPAHRHHETMSWASARLWTSENQSSHLNKDKHRLGFILHFLLCVRRHEGRYILILEKINLLDFRESLILAFNIFYSLTYPERCLFVYLRTILIFSCEHESCWGRASGQPFAFSPKQNFKLILKVNFSL